MAYPFSRLEVSIPTASSDGLFYGRFPHGDKPASNLAGLATDATAASGALSTAIKLAAGAADALSASASLTTGAGSGSAPTNVQVILQGQTKPGATTCFSGVLAGQSANFNQIGWQGVAGATSYNIYRAVNGSPTYTLYANTTASAAATAYSSYVSTQGSAPGGPFPAVPGNNCAYIDTAATGIVGPRLGSVLKVSGSVTSGSSIFTVTGVTTGSVTLNQGIGGPGIQPGTTIASFGTGSGGAGTYNLSQPALSSQTAQIYGTVYFGNQGYTYYVTAVVGGVESSPSAFAILPYVVNGEFLLCGGVFNGVVVSNQPCPAPSPLGYNNAMEWQLSPANFALINAFAGNSAASDDLSTVGYPFINFAIYLPAVTGSSTAMQANAEIATDGQLVNVTALSTWGPAAPTPGAWTTWKIPMGGSNGIYIDNVLGATNVPQTGFYKITWQFGTQPTWTANAFVEIWFSVN